MGTLSKLRRLVLRDNVSVREAARRLNISRNTAKKYLEQPEMTEPRYPKRQSAPGLLDPYKEQLKQWLNDEVAKPLNAADFAEYAADPGLASEIYLASVMLVDDQQDAERSYLDELAAQLQIDANLQLHLEQQAKA